MAAGVDLHGLDKMLISSSANGIAFIGPPSEVRKIIPSAQWIFLALRFFPIAVIFSTGLRRQALYSVDEELFTSQDRNAIQLNDGMAMLIGDEIIPSWLSGQYLSSSGMIV